MIGENWPVVNVFLGLGQDPLTLWHMAARTFIVYLAAIILVRLGEKRFLGKYAALDVILGFALGSILSSAVTGSSAFFETLGASLVLVLLHWLFAVLAFHSDRFGDLVKGNKRMLIKDGQIQWDAMQATHISEKDLLAALRTAVQTEDPQQIKIAHLERSGDISAIPRQGEPQIIEVQVENGVQVIRIKMD
jgi:uncharacterized membrane protein YcaP (DUF421 family)